MVNVQVKTTRSSNPVVKPEDVKSRWPVRIFRPVVAGARAWVVPMKKKRLS